MTPTNSNIFQLQYDKNDETTAGKLTKTKMVNFYAEFMKNHRV